MRMRRCGEIIRFHSDNYSLNGDLSVSGSALFWESFCSRMGCRLKCSEGPVLQDRAERRQLIKLSRKQLLPMQEIFPLGNQRFAIRLIRTPIIRHVLTSILTLGDNYGRPLGKSSGKLELCLTLNMPANYQACGATDLRHHRLQRLYDIMIRLVVFSGCDLVPVSKATAQTPVLCVEMQRCHGTDDPGHVCVVCGPVLEPDTKMATMLTMQDYLELRSTHMQLMALHRSGLRPQGSCSLNTLMHRLGEAALIVDLFEVRHASAAKVVRNGCGSSKGAAYILYNSARIETLLRNFENQVNLGVYESLPGLDKIDFTLLEDDLDWQLIYGCLLHFPEVVESTLDQLKQGLVGVHLLIRYMDNLATVFSRYYRVKKILVQKREQLVPILYARITLVMAVRQVMNLTFQLIGIHPVDYV
ncbi:hypothetical protein KR018_008293 [Drosophila ironensis]|nr:hypothetical protein KR018_008293 [Drosophila ironensis]